ncbi:MAG: DivIVA domain-containing protein [Clostridia bacterium]|nr:DivIVA domain-containing protein [Clostridia bacterium]MDD4376405.1 DivIVA domain-containing protein [Clostridia bacterium]
MKIKFLRRVKLSGYDINDVEDFLEKIIVDYEKLMKENMELKDRVNNLQESVAYYKSLEIGIDQTVGNAQTEAEAIKEDAHNTADKIKKDVMMQLEQYKKNEEERINRELEELKKEVLTKEISLEEIKKQMQIYKIKTISMLEAQIKILNEE